MTPLVRSVLRVVRVAVVPFSVFTVAVFAVTVVAGRRDRLLVLVFLIVVGVASSWLNDVMRDDRDRHPTDARARTFLTLGQLLVGVVLLFFGWHGAGALTNFFVFFGLTQLIMAVAALISEGRTRPMVRRQGALVLGAAAIVFACSMLVSAGAGLASVVVLGAVAAEVGTEFVSEASHRWKTAQKPQRRAAFVAVGVVLWLVATLWWVTTGVSDKDVLFIMLGLLIVVWLVASDNVGLAVVLVGAVVLVWASAPTEVKLTDTPQAQPAPHAPYFAVLGDSYISGEGAPRFFAPTNETASNRDQTNECRRAPTAWPVLLTKDTQLALPRHLAFIACSGAVTQNIAVQPRLDAQGHQHGPAELALFDRVKSTYGSPAFVLLSIGGNDASFGTIGTTCVGPGDCSEIGQQFLNDPTRPNDIEERDPNKRPGIGGDEDLAHIADNLDAAYTRVSADVGRNIPVIVVPYPIPLGTGATCSKVLLDVHERDLLRAFVPELNRAIKAAAARHGFLYMDTMEQALVRAGSELCNQTGTAAGINFVALNPKSGTARDALNPANWFHDSLHPNTRGHQAMAGAAATWFTQHSPLVPPAPASNSRYEVQDINGLLPADQRVSPCTPADALSCELAFDGWKNANITRFYRTFLPVALFTMLAAWLIVAPARWFGRSKRLTLRKTAKRIQARVTGNVEPGA